jgi:Family of unknown function (DUF5723)
MKKFTFLVLGITFLPAISFAQIYFGSPIAASNGGSVTATALNWETIDINPANLGRPQNHTFSLSIMNVALNFQDNGLNLASKGIIPEIKGLGSQDSITPQQRQQMYDAVTKPGGLNTSTTVNWVAFSFTLPHIGGFGIALTDRMFAHAQVNPSAAKLITDFVGVKDSSTLVRLAHQDSALFTKSPAQLLDGTNAGGYHYRELDIDYARKILTINIHNKGTGDASFENSEYFNYATQKAESKTTPLIIYGGIGIKPIWGLGSYSSTLSGVSDLINSEEGSYVYSDPDYTKNLFSDIFKANGRGFGTDLGLTATYKKWALAVSANDIGKITWHNNSFGPYVVNFPPLDSIPILFKNNADILKRFYHQPSSDNTGGFPDYTTELPTQFRAGLSYQVGKILTLSSDFVAPLNNVQGNLLAPYYAVGAHFDFWRYFGVGIGYATEKGFGNLLPMGIYLNILFGVEIYVGTNDAFAYINNQTGHVLSAEFGVKILGF